MTQIDTAIRRLAFAEARSTVEALVNVGQRRVETDRALSQGKAEGDKAADFAREARQVNKTA